MKASANELRRIAEWLVAGDTGMSSKSLCAIYLGLPQKRWQDVSYPHDPSDLRRCLGFLDCVEPSKRRALIRIAAGYRKEWRAISDNWERLVELYEKEHHQQKAPELYALMKQLGL